MPSLTYSHHAHEFHFVIQHLLLQASTSPAPPSAFMAINKLLNCIVYEAIEEALHEVCMRLPIACAIICFPSLQFIVLAIRALVDCNGLSQALCDTGDALVAS
jgi:hypothetical protein